MVRDVQKIYVVCDGDLSARPRYALISDLKPRNGRGNLIEQINARVVDVDFANRSIPVEDRKLVVFDSNGKIIMDNNGNPIVADSAIAATGFTPQLQKIFQFYTEGKLLVAEGPNAVLQPLTLPTNPAISVADTFTADSSIVLLGTASQPRFNSLEKLAQLPKEAREALLRNSAENAVAVGFRAPDTQAAVNAWLGLRNINVVPEADKPRPSINLDGNNSLENTQSIILCAVDQKNLQIPNNIDDEELLLSPLLSYILGNSFNLTTNFTGNIDFNLTFNPQQDEFVLTFNEGDVKSVSPEFLKEVNKALSNDYFQRYALSLLSKRRRDPKLNLNIAFKSGEINPKNTFVQTK